MEPTNQGLKDGCPFQTTRFSNFIRWFSRVYAPQKWLKIFLPRRAPPDPGMKVGAHNFAYFGVKNNPSYQFIRPFIGAPCHSMYKLDPKRPPTRWTSFSFGSTHLGGKNNSTPHQTLTSMVPLRRKIKRLSGIQKVAGAKGMSWQVLKWSTTPWAPGSSSKWSES